MQHPMLVDAVTNTKKATVLITLGLRLAQQGVFILFDEKNPHSSGGVAHFLFESNLANTVRQCLSTYDAGTAHDDLQNFLDAAKGKNPEIDKFIVALEPFIRNALIVYGRRFLDQHQQNVRSLKSGEIAAYVRTGGTPVFDNQGNMAGIEDFRLQKVKVALENCPVCGSQRQKIIVKGGRPK